jgi:hypothetical protein
MLDSVTLLLLRTISLPPRTERGPSASLLVARWAVRLSCSSMVYFKKLFGGRKCGSGYALRAPLLDAFDPGLLGPRPCSSGHHVLPGMGFTHGIRVVCPRSPSELDGKLEVQCAGPAAMASLGMRNQPVVMLSLP